MITVTYENNFEKKTKDFKIGDEEKCLRFLRAQRKKNEVQAKNNIIVRKYSGLSIRKPPDQCWFFRVNIVKTLS